MILTRTKKIITFGPSMDSYLGWKDNFSVNNDVLDKYSKFINNGVDCIRFNMSHDLIDNHEKRFNSLRKLNDLTSKKVSILIDTKGPEIRVGKIQESNKASNLIFKDQEVIIKTNDPNFIGNGKQFSVTDSTKTYDLSIDLNLGDLIYVADGKLVLQVTKIDKDSNLIYTISKTEKFEISSSKRINLVNKKYHLPFISEYDVLTIQKAVIWKADFLALSFLSNIDQLNDVKKIISETDKNSNIKIIAKIENFEALENIDLLINECDGIMVARGDLALEIGFEKVPYYEDIIVKKCLEKSKISIIATQVLDSLEKSLIPTRAESYDCYNVVKLSANAVMLSGETASGNNPLNSVIQMNKIIEFAETINFQNLTQDTPFIEVITECTDIKEFSYESNNKIAKISNFQQSDIWMTLLKKVYFIN